MKTKVFVVVLAVLLVSLGAFAEWKFYRSYAPLANESGQFCDTDGLGRLWVTDYGAPGFSCLRVYDTVAGTEITSFTQGMDNVGAPQPFLNPGGVAYDPVEGVIYATNYAGWVGLFRFNASLPAPGPPVPGINLNTFVWGTGLMSAAPGDCDICTSGSKTYVVLVRKTSAQWGFLDPLIPAPVTPVLEFAGPTGFGSHINRGISCLPNSMRVFIGDEASDVVDVWNKVPANPPATLYVKSGTPLDTTAAADQAGCEVDDFAGGTQFHCLVSLRGTVNQLRIYDAVTLALLDTVPVASEASKINSPRGASYSNDDQRLCVVEFTGMYPIVQEFRQPPASVTDWIKF